MATTVNYEDERFTQVESDKQQALTDVENTYGGMINESDKFYENQIQISKDWAETQKQNQQEQTDFAIEQIEQQKDKAQKDYTKEQSGAYVDWQKQSNQYGANAEQMAASGLQNTGYSESSQVSMYNTYQNRVSTARESFNNAILNYNNSIKDAQLQNSAALAEIAYNALQQQLQLSLEQFQYKNNLLLQLTNQKQQINSEYYNRWMDVVGQINTENALAEEIRQYNEKMAEDQRQFNETMAYQKAKDAQEQANWEKEYELAKKNTSSSGGSGGGYYYQVVDDDEKDDTPAKDPGGISMLTGTAVTNSGIGNGRTVTINNKTYALKSTGAKKMVNGKNLTIYQADGATPARYYILNTTHGTFDPCDKNGNKL